MQTVNHVHSDGTRASYKLKPGSSFLVELAKLKPAKPTRIKADRRSYPKYEPGMSTAEYVRQFEMLNGHTKNHGFWANLNHEPAAVYVGIDTAETIEDEAHAAPECEALPDVQPAELAQPAPVESVKPARRRRAVELASDCAKAAPAPEPVAPLPTAPDVSADVAIAADTLERLTNQLAHCAYRRAAIESGRRGHVSALAYILPALERLAQHGRGLERTEARRALEQLRAARPDLAPAAADAESSHLAGACLERYGVADPASCAHLAGFPEWKAETLRAFRAADCVAGPYRVMIDGEKTAGEAPTIDEARELTRRLAGAEPFPCMFTIHGPDGEWIEDAATSGGIPSLQPGAASESANVPAEPVAIDWQILAARPETYYATPARTIGRHEWLCVVYRHDVYGPCTDYLWRRVSQNRGAFKRGRDWPTYDGDDCDNGMPRTLRKLYAEHATAIAAALESGRTMNPAPDAPEWNPPETVDVQTLAREEVRAWSDAKTSAELEALEEVNAHSEAAVILAMRHGTPADESEAREVLAQHLSAGHLAPDLYARRRALLERITAAPDCAGVCVAAAATPADSAEPLTPSPAIAASEPPPVQSRPVCAELAELVPGEDDDGAVTRPHVAAGRAWCLRIMRGVPAAVRLMVRGLSGGGWSEGGADVPPGMLERLTARHAGLIERYSRPRGLSITITRAEGLAEECGKPETVYSFAEADALLLRWSESAPARGGYDKCDFSICWADCGEYRGRYDLKHHSAEPPSLTRHMIDLCDFYSGRACPEHLTEKRYAEHLEHVGEDVRSAYAVVRGQLEAAGAWRDITRPAPVDLRGMLCGGHVAPADLVGVGVRYTGGHGPYATEGASGAITECELTQWGARLAVTLEDGRTLHDDGAGFVDSLTPARFRVDWKRHGAPYLAQLAAAVAARTAATSSAAEMAKQAHQAARAQLLAEHPDLERAPESSRHDSLTIAARNMRRLLAARWPGVKFSVRVERFSMGDSMDVSWTDGPTVGSVDELADRFSAGSFDGMEDCYRYSRTAWTELFGSAKYVHTRRTLSDDAVAAIIAKEWEGIEERPTVADYRGSAWQQEDARRRIWEAAKTWEAPALPAKRARRRTRGAAA